MGVSLSEQARCFLASRLLGFTLSPLYDLLRAVRLRRATKRRFTSALDLLYCAAFALLCERAGIRCIVVGGNAPNSPDNHAWNVVLIDGENYHIDVTHDDPVPDRKGSVSYRDFGLTDDEMTSYGYVWDKDCTAIRYFY